jgi:hypothetical protein
MAVNFCPKCNVNVKDDDFGIECDGFCRKWFHSSCIGLSKKKYNSIKDLGNHVHWYCNDCQIEVKSVLHNSPAGAPICSKSTSDENGTKINLILDELCRINKNFVNLCRKVEVIENFHSVTSNTDHVVDSDDASSMNVLDNISELSIENDFLGFGECSNDKVEGIDKPSDQASVENIKLLGMPLNCGSQICREDWKEVTKRNRSKNNRPFKNKISQIVPVSQINKIAVSSNTNSSNVRSDSNRPIGSNKNSATQQSVFTDTKNNADKPSSKRIVGNGRAASSCLTPAQRKEWIFISRLSADTKSESVTEYIKQLTSGEVLCEEVQSKFPTYKSFKVGVDIGNKGNIMNPDIWPEGVLVSNYRFHNRKSHSNSRSFLGRRNK